jgi:hypothetical protein
MDASGSPLIGAAVVVLADAEAAKAEKSPASEHRRRGQVHRDGHCSGITA